MPIAQRAARGRHRLLWHLRVLCKEVNVPVVCPRSLRGHNERK